jgi:hypothetical protein
MHQQRIAVAIAAGIGTICSLTPWASPRWLTAAGGDDLANLRWITLVCCAAVVIGMVSVRRTEPLTPGGKGLCRLSGGLTTLLSILGIIGINSVIDDDLPLSRSATVNPSLYLLLMAGAAVAVLPNVLPLRSGAQS